VADLDGDTLPDLVTLNVFSFDVSVLLGNGDGTFQAPFSEAAGRFPACAVNDVAAADLNDDTLPDLVIALGYADGVSVLLNQN
jgi:hypothetical protein